MMGNLPKYRSPLQSISWLATSILVLIALFLLYPFIWMFLSSFKANREIFRPLQIWPESFNPEFYRQLISGEWIPFIRVFFNSMLVALSQSIGTLALTSAAGYIFAKHEFKGRRLLFVLAVVVIVVPRQAMAIPMFSWLNALKLTDTLLGVILPGMVSGLGIIYFTQVFRHVPQPYVDTARMAGAGELRVYWTLLPLIGSALLSFGLIHFILAWHEHLIPMLVLSSEEKQTLPLALASLFGSSLRFPYAVLMAGSSLTILPTVVLFALLQRRFKSSMAELLAH